MTITPPPASRIGATTARMPRKCPVRLTSIVRRQAAALELGPYGIRVNSLHPGMIRTAMTAGAPEQKLSAGIPLARFGEPEEVARTMLFIVCDATYASGSAFPVDGGMLSGIAFEG